MQRGTVQRREGLTIPSLARSMRLTQWSLRKLRLPIRPNDLVLDVGSGGSPHPRADVLLERYVAGQHRHGVAPVVDRPIVFADGCRMPFRDKAFDYVIAFHVLEHITRPELFLAELMRVARAGYIETPNVIFERLVPYDVHCLEVMNLDGRLIIYKKNAPAMDAFSAGLKIVPRSPKWNRFFYGNPAYFHVCYHWKDRIQFEIVNPEETCAWYKLDSEDTTNDVVTSSAGARAKAIKALHKFYSFRRKSSVALKNLLVCPACRVDLVETGSTFRCEQCGSNYPNQPWPLFTAPMAATSSRVR